MDNVITARTGVMVCKKHDTEQFGELELCKYCRDIADDGELEECMCGALASRDGHTYCRDCD